MEVISLEIEGLKLIRLKVYRDNRGFFMERYQQERFRETGLATSFLQDNHSRSAPGVLRGLHFQRDPGQGKLVGVIRGSIWDVVVDIRQGSPTFGKSLGLELNDENGSLLWVPAGFAHGFCVLGKEPADVLYKVDAPYHAQSEGGIHWADPDLAIAWPVKQPLLSGRDEQLPGFAQFRMQQENPGSF